MIRTVRQSKLSYFILFFFLFLLGWWFRIAALGIKDTQENYLYGFAYSFIALIGGVNGFLISKKWGGRKSLMGKGIIFLSLGLLGEWFGQTVWSYYNIVKSEPVPYPSIGDIGYFSIIPFYALGMFYFAKAMGAKFNLKTLKGKLAVTIIPLIMVSIAYQLFLKDLSFDLKTPIKTFLDYGYPVGEAVMISVALVTFELSRGLLGGRMRGRMLFLIFAFVIQYVTDTTFVYQFAKGTYYNAGIVDFMYMISFTVMTFGLIALRSYE